MDNEKIKVLFIAGSGRSGSTILHNILAQVDGFFATGEIRYIWNRGLMKNMLCGCGVPVRECELWKNVMDVAYGGIDRVDAAKMFHLTESFRIHDLPLTLIPYIRHKQIFRLNEYLKNLEKLYQAIKTTTNCRVIVDSSKNPSYGYVLNQIPTIDLYVLHFIRESQAVAYSWSKKKHFQPGELMARKRPVESALQWNARNITAEMFLNRTSTRHMALRYEDFVRAPQTSFQSIINLLGEKVVNLPFVGMDTVELNKVNHSVFGNPVRFQNGPVKLRLDNKWQTKMNKRQKLSVLALTWPLLLKYGYLRAGPHSANRP